MLLLLLFLPHPHPHPYAQPHPAPPNHDRTPHPARATTATHTQTHRDTATRTPILTKSIKTLSKMKKQISKKQGVSTMMGFLGCHVFAVALLVVVVSCIHHRKHKPRGRLSPKGTQQLSNTLLICLLRHHKGQNMLCFGYTSGSEIPMDDLAKRAHSSTQTPLVLCTLTRRKKQNVVLFGIHECKQNPRGRASPKRTQQQSKTIGFLHAHTPHGGKTWCV